MGTNRGREQSGTRPAVVVSSANHLELVTELVVVVPCTSRDRSWPNHILLSGRTGLTQPTFAMTEQVHTLDRQAILRPLGSVDAATLRSIRAWLDRWLV